MRHQGRVFTQKSKNKINSIYQRVEEEQIPFQVVRPKEGRNLTPKDYLREKAF